MGGGFAYVNGVPTGNLVRLNGDGSVDPTFQVGSGFNNLVTSLAPVDGSAILAGGGFSSYDGAPCGAVARLSVDGTLDASFDARDANVASVHAVHTRTDGRVWVGGTFPALSDRPAAIARLHRDGRLDPSFAGGSGMRRTYGTQFGTVTDTGGVNAILPRADGGIVVSGGFHEFNGTTRKGIARIHENGMLDPNFLPGAELTPYVGPGTAPGGAKVMDLLPDGRLLTAGQFVSYDGVDVGGIIRLNDDGRRDATFASDSQFDATVHAIAQSDGQVIVTGTFPSYSGIARPSFARLTANGALDPSFVVLDAPVNFESTSELAFRADGSLLVGGGWRRYGDFRGSGLILLEPVDDAPVIQTAPQSQVTTAGGATTLSVAATGVGHVAYRWQRLESLPEIAHTSPAIPDTWVDVAGATNTTYTIPSTQSFHGGSYRVIVTSNGTSLASDPVVVTVNAAPPSPSRLLNLSTRGFAQAGDNVLIPGFVISGSATKRLLIRAVGPSLSPPPFSFGDTVAPDPQMTLRRYDTTLTPSAYVEVESNDDWQTNLNAADITTTAAQVFAFPFSDAKEAALLMDLGPGQYTVTAGDKNGTSGIAIVERYDGDTPSTGSGEAGSRLINISNRGFAGIGDQVMIPGFVVSSEGPKTVLVRVVGPTLGSFGVPGTMSDPKLTVYSGPTAILANDNWGDNPDAAYTAQIASAVQAFPLAAGSADAAFVVTLQAGSYTVVGSSATTGGTGVVLVEVYVVP